MGSGMSTTGATTRPGLTPRPCTTVGDWLLTATSSLGAVSRGRAVRRHQDTRRGDAPLPRVRLGQVRGGSAAPFSPRNRGVALSKAEQIRAALGGDGNVVDLEPCITRLRVEVTDAQLVDEAALKASGAFGVVRSGRIVQVIVGPEADNLAAELDSLR